jgi:putative copper export protein
MTAAQLAPAIDGLRVSLHVLAATIWVGGQLTVAGLLPAVRRLGPEAPRRIANAFARVSWPAYVVLLGTGVWNVTAATGHRSSAWNVVLGVKIAVVVLAGLAAWLHGRSKTRAGLAVWGAVAGAASVSALVTGVFLAG